MHIRTQLDQRLCAPSHFYCDSQLKNDVDILYAYIGQNYVQQRVMESGKQNEFIMKNSTEMNAFLYFKKIWSYINEKMEHNGLVTKWILNRNAHPSRNREARHMGDGLKLGPHFINMNLNLIKLNFSHKEGDCHSVEYQLGTGSLTGGPLQVYTGESQAPEWCCLIKPWSVNDSPTIVPASLLISDSPWPWEVPCIPAPHQHYNLKILSRGDRAEKCQTPVPPK